RNPLYRRVIRETLAFVERELTSPEGAFWSALDADSEGVEGQFYVWTPKEIEAAIPDATARKLFERVYGLNERPNFEDKHTILTLARPLAECARELGVPEPELESRLAEARRQALAVRDKRPRPFLDTKVLTGWNGQMIAAYAAAGRSLSEPKYL